MGLRGALAGKLAFGLSVGLAAVFVIGNGGDLGSISPLVWVPAAAAIVLTGITVSGGQPTLLVLASAAWLAATVPLLLGALWPLPLAASVLVLLAARLSGQGWLSHTLGRVLGLVAGGGLLFGLYNAVTGDVAWDVGQGVSLAVFVAGLGALVVLGWWPRDGFGGKANET